MYRVTKTFRFEAAHRLPYHDGKCQRLHGHSFVGHAILEGEALQQTGPKADMLVDFGDISKALAPLVENYLDHHFLNETTGLESPTSERLARWIYHQLKLLLPNLAAIIVEETCTSSAEYRP